jgi:hypothetical protein
VGLPICVLAKVVVEIAGHLASGVVERRHHPCGGDASLEKRQWSFLLRCSTDVALRYCGE